jgi:DNA-binding GntR family transcriptional regulator
VTELVERINRHADRPVYRQLSGLIEARLAATARPGDRLPSEAELSRRFRVNRLTVRRALDELNRRGIIETIHGKGSFVAAPIVRYDVSAGRDASFTRSMRALGRAVTIRLLGTEICETRRWQRELHTSGPLRTWTTVRLVDGQPWSLSRTTIGTDRFAELTDVWTGETSLYDLLQERYGVRIYRAYRTFSAQMAEPQDVEHLHVPVGAPVLQLQGLNVDQKDQPVALVQHRFRGDRIQFTVE